LKEYLSNDFYPRFGGGIGVTRLVRALKLKEDTPIGSNPIPTAI